MSIFQFCQTFSWRKEQEGTASGYPAGSISECFYWSFMTQVLLAEASKLFFKQQSWRKPVGHRGSMYKTVVPLCWQSMKGMPQLGWWACKIMEFRLCTPWVKKTEENFSWYFQFKFRDWTIQQSSLMMIVKILIGKKVLLILLYVSYQKNSSLKFHFLNTEQFIP